MNKPLQLKRLYFIKPLIISLLLVAAYGVASSEFDIAALKARDFFSRLKYRIKPIPEEVKDVVIISIDSRAYDWFDRKWPWPRIVHANLIYKLTEYKPRIMALNLAFVGESQRKGEDDLLAQAFEDAGNVYIATYYDMEGRHHPPCEKLASAVKGFGSTNKPGDKDSVIRHTKLFSASVSNIILNYSFEFKIACDFLGIPLEEIDFDGKRLLIPTAEGRKRIIPVKADGTVVLNYEARPVDFTLVPILDVLQGKVSPEIFKDKIVIAGMTGELFEDIHHTSMGPMPGAGIIANNIVMLLHHSFIKEIPRGINLLILAFFAIIMGILTYRTGLLRGFISLLLLTLLFYLISIGIIISNLTWDFFGVPLVILCVFIVIDSPKFINLIRETLTSKKKVIRDTLTGLSTPQYLQVRLQSDLQEAIKKNEDLSLVLFGINNYASLKATLETSETEEILKQVARLIRRYSRKTRYIDFISRYGEDRFCAVLRTTEAIGAQVYAKRIQEAVEKERFLGKKELTTSLGVGIAVYPIVKPGTADEFIKYAEADFT